jgi:hypothetical protein
VQFTKTIKTVRLKSQSVLSGDEWSVSRERQKFDRWVAHISILYAILWRNALIQFISIHFQNFELIIEAENARASSRFDLEFFASTRFTKLEMI